MTNPLTRSDESAGRATDIFVRSLTQLRARTKMSVARPHENVSKPDPCEYGLSAGQAARRRPLAGGDLLTSRAVYY